MSEATTKSALRERAVRRWGTAPITVEASFRTGHPASGRALYAWIPCPVNLWGTNLASDAEPREPMSLRALSQPLLARELRTF